MSDAEIVASAREAELRALFAQLYKSLAGGDAFAAETFAHGANLLDAAQEIALSALALSAGQRGPRANG